MKGFKKILVLYTNYGRQRKPEKTNWVMHQYHLGNNEEEKDGELVVSKVFYQTQPRQCGSSKDVPAFDHHKGVNIRGEQGHDGLISAATNPLPLAKKAGLVEYYDPGGPFINYDHHQHNYTQGGDNRESPPQLIPNLVVQGDGSSFIRLTSDASKGKLERK